MKNNKKSLPVLPLAGLVIIVIAAALAACSKAESVSLDQILEGEAEFLFVSDGTAEPKTMEDVPALFDPDNAYDTKIWDFAALDLDGDGQNEVILSVSGVAGDMGGKLILHQIEDQIYGYQTDSRTLTSLKADGTGSYSDPTGTAEIGICTVSSFTTTGYTLKKISYGIGTYQGLTEFVVNEQPATESEYLSAIEQQEKKTDAVWHEFTSENIRNGLEEIFTS